MYVGSVNIYLEMTLFSICFPGKFYLKKNVFCPFMRILMLFACVLPVEGKYLIFFSFLV